MSNFSACCMLICSFGAMLSGMLFIIVAISEGIDMSVLAVGGVSAFFLLLVWGIARSSDKALKSSISEAQRKIKELSLSKALQLESAWTKHENRVKVIKAHKLYRMYQGFGGDMNELPVLPILDDKYFCRLMDNSEYVNEASYIWGKLIDSDGKWKKHSIWSDTYRYESGLPRGFQSSEPVKLLAVIDEQLYFFMDNENEASITLSCIKRIQAVPSKEKVRLRISWLDKKHGLKDTVLYVDAVSEVTAFNNGNTRTDWDNSNAIRTIDELQQEINHAQEHMSDSHGDRPINVAIDINIPKYHNDLQDMIKSATSPKELLTDVHGILESLLHNIFTFASSQTKPTFAELINFASEEGFIDDVKGLHQARIIRNNRSHRGHEVSNENCLEANKTYAKSIRYVLEKLELRAAGDGTSDWRNEVL